MLINDTRKKHGFTLAEILVSMFIIITLTTLLLVNYHSTNKRSELVMATQKLASDIRLTQEYALGSKEFYFEEVSQGVPPGGWGIRFVQPDYVYIFADNEPGGATNILGYYKTINLPKGISLISNNVSIVFEQPNPTVYIEGGASSVIIELTNGESNKRIKVNFLGLVDVMD